jgi:tetratricopeptide (TPR) repeat protein
MASLAHASSDFVDALRRGLEAYDAGNNKKAYAIFDEALDIEPDNVWGLVWKGATAPTPTESKEWLEQAVAIDANNKHAIAGLQWVKEVLQDGSALPAPEAEESLMQPKQEELIISPPAPTQRAFIESDSFTDVVTPPVREDVEELPDWLSTEATSEAEALPDWLNKETTPAVPESSEELPNWLEGTSEPPAVSESDDLHDWFGAEEQSVPQPAEESAPLPDWLEPGASTPASDSGALPDWLTQGTTTPAVEEPADLPQWLNEESTTPAVSEQSDLPDWLSGDSEAGTSSDELPSWLENEEPGDFQAQRAKGSLAPSSDAVEAYQSGLLAYEEDRLDDATIAFERVIRLDPTHVEAHNYLGSVFYLNGRPNNAINALQRALELDENHTETYLNLGLVYKETGSSNDAVRMFRRYLDLAPADDSTAMYVQELIDELGG